MELHRKVSSLIEFLKQKWALHEVRIVSFSDEVKLQCQVRIKAQSPPGLGRQTCQKAEPCVRAAAHCSWVHKVCEGVQVPEGESGEHDQLW